MICSSEYDSSSESQGRALENSTESDEDEDSDKEMRRERKKSSEVQSMGRREEEGGDAAMSVETSKPENL